MTDSPGMTTIDDDMVILVEEYLERDLVPDEVAEDVAALRAAGQIQEAADLIVQARRDQDGRRR